MDADVAPSEDEGEGEEDGDRGALWVGGKKESVPWASRQSTCEDGEVIHKMEAEEIEAVVSK